MNRADFNPISIGRDPIVFVVVGIFIINKETRP